MRPLGACKTAPSPEMDRVASSPVLPPPFPPLDPVDPAVDDLPPQAASTMAAPTNSPKISFLRRIPIVSTPLPAAFDATGFSLGLRASRPHRLRLGPNRHTRLR